MINEAHVFLSGFVATEPTFKKAASGASSARLRVAYTSRRLNRETGEWADGPTSFVTVQCWRTLADNVAMCLRKGEPVLVRGRLQVRRYENSQGVPRLSVEVDASSVGHDLTRGVAHFSRTRRAVGETAAELAGGLAAAAGGSDDEAELGPLPDGGQPAEDGPGSEAGPAAGGGRGSDGVPVTGREPAAGSVRDPLAGLGDTVVDEQAVAEFARELNDSLSEDREVGVPL